MYSLKSKIDNTLYVINFRRIYWTDNKLDSLETSDYFGLKRYVLTAE